MCDALVICPYKILVHMFRYHNLPFFNNHYIDYFVEHSVLTVIIPNALSSNITNFFSFCCSYLMFFKLFSMRSPTLYFIASLCMSLFLFSHLSSIMGGGYPINVPEILLLLASLFCHILVWP